MPAFDAAGSEKILSSAEKARAARYRFDKDRQRYIAGRASLRRILAERTGTRAGELAIEEPEGEKPRLTVTTGAPGIFFNVSHSGDYAVIAVSDTAEVGIDIAGRTPRRWAESDFETADVVVTMGCGDTCPFVPGKRYEDWKLDDPAGQGIEAVRPIRDEIETRVRDLLERLVGPPS